jgi:hypothetical protein
MNLTLSMLRALVEKAKTRCCICSNCKEKYQTDDDMRCCQPTINADLLLSALREMEEGEKDKLEFMECVSCATKPGSPTLCRACANNRQVISILSDKGKKERTCPKHPCYGKTCCIDPDEICKCPIENPHP